MVVRASAGDGDTLALANHSIKIRHLTVKRVPDFRGNCRALVSALHHVVPRITKASAATD
jgi:hypothetical protein